MTLYKSLLHDNQELIIAVNYDPKSREVTEVKYVRAWRGRTCIDLTEILANHFNLDEVVDKIDWTEIAAEMQVPVDDDDEEGWRE